MKPFTEEVCVAGAQIMLEEIQSRLSELVGDNIIGNDKPWEDMYVCSACRPDKFSLHAVMGRLFVDRSFLSGPVVAYKIARLFSIRNVIWLLWSDDTRRWKTPEGRFCIKSLMIEDLLASTPRYRCQRDTVIDKCVYLRKHLMRMPGCAKPDGSWPLHPIPIPRDVSLLDTRPVAVAPSEYDPLRMIIEVGDFSTKTT